MKKPLLLSLIVLSMVFAATTVKAQFNPYAENTKLLTAGVGVSGYGVPIFARIDIPVANNFTVGGGLSYQSFNRFGATGFSLIGIQARGNYHFNELFEITEEQWDVYGGASLGYYIYDTPAGSFTGGLGGLFLGIQIGGRYFVSDNIGLNLELGGGTVLSGANLGVTFLF